MRSGRGVGSGVVLCVKLCSAILATMALVSSSARAGESAEAIWAGPGLRVVTVDPSGDWIAAIAHRGVEESVVVQRIGTPTLGSVVTEKRIIGITWDGPGALVVEAVTPAEVYTVHVVSLAISGERIVPRHRRITAPGRLVDALPLVPEKLLWLGYGQGFTSVHRLSIDEIVDFARLHNTRGRTINIGERVAVAEGMSTHIGSSSATARPGQRFAA